MNIASDSFTLKKPIGFFLNSLVRSEPPCEIMCIWKEKWAGIFRTQVFAVTWMSISRGCDGRLSLPDSLSICQVHLLYSHIHTAIVRHSVLCVMELVEVDYCACRRVVKWNFEITPIEIAFLIEEIKYTPSKGLFFPNYPSVFPIEQLIIKTISPQWISFSSWTMYIKVFRSIENLLSLRCSLNFKH